LQGGYSVIVNELAEKEEAAKLSHASCRDDQQKACDLSTQCNNTRDEKWQIVEFKEDSMNASYSAIRAEWCIPEVEGEIESKILSQEFYDDNVKIYETYKRNKKAAALAWDDYKAQLPICEELTQAYLTQHASCISSQTALEKASCDRANHVNTFNEEIKNKWNEASSIYTPLVNTTLEMATERQLEWQGVHTVKCLLDRIHDNAVSDTPCNETSDPDTITGQIDSCHKAEDISHLVISPEPIPETPVPFVLKAYPCSSGYADFIGYTDLLTDSPCAPAEPCNGAVAGCASTLPAEDEPEGTAAP